jgi:hypothetical protein
MHLAVLAISFAVVGSALTPAAAGAAPLQLRFQGTWGFHDPYDQNPDFWNALNALGVVQGSPLTLSMLVSDADTNPDVNVGTYSVFASELQVGNVTLTAPPTSLEVSGFGDAHMFGTWVGAPAGSYVPNYMQLSYRGGVPPPSDQLADVLPYLNGWRNDLFIGYTSATCVLCLGVSQVTLTSVQAVPEPGSFAAIAAGLLLLAPSRWRRARGVR